MGKTIGLQKKQKVYGKHNMCREKQKVYGGKTIGLREKQKAQGKNNRFIGKTKGSGEKQQV